MALAIRFEGLLRDGTQEEVLFLPPVEGGRDMIHERLLRDVCTEVRWTRQGLRWSAAITSPVPGSPPAAAT